MDLNLVKAQFFDSKKVVAEVDAATRKGLSRIGAYVRRRMKSSIKNAPKIDVATGQVTRKRKGLTLKGASATKGQPPYSHDGTLKRLIFFTYERSTRSVLVGPAIFTPKRRTQTRTAPDLLEHGGPVVIRYRSGKTRKLYYRGNPFVMPAVLAESPNFARLFKEGAAQ